MSETGFTFPATREAALRRLASFTASMGYDYSSRRNNDLGPKDRSNVSCLSAAVRHRLVLEEELVRGAIAAHGLKAAEKFVQEVCWRTYWKGWLEMRPAVWEAYCESRDAALERVASTPVLRRQYERAVAGQTGIACFDAWAHELTELGYLHNHARMWFASIWIYTLKLPWQLGADFFLRHLIDADAASNTLSWRWVCGLHTQGKTYLARPSNIETYTGGRFKLPDGQLASEAPPLDDDAWQYPVVALKESDTPDTGIPALLLLHEEDLNAESWPLGGVKPKGLATMEALGWRSPLPAGDRAAQVTRTALADGLARAAQHFALPVPASPDAPDLAGLARTAGAGQIITMRAMTGPLKDRLDRQRPSLDAAGIRLVELRRDWDRAFHPHARRGFFKLKEAIPGVLQALGMV